TITSYLDHDSKAPQAKPSVPWLRTELKQARVPEDTFPGRQAWKLLVTIDTGKLEPGKHLAQVDLKPDDPEAPVKTVPVELDLTPTLKIHPGSLAFGKVAAGQTVEQKVLLNLRTTSDSVNLADLKMEHDLGEQLKVTTKQLSEKVLLISAALTPARTNKSHS